MIKRLPVAVTIADGQSAGTGTAQRVNGLLRGILVNAPQLDGTVTLTVAITDSDGFTMFSKASIAENTKTAIYVDANNYPLQIPLGDGSYTVTVTASGTQSGGNDTVTVVLLVDK